MPSWTRSAVRASTSFHRLVTTRSGLRERKLPMNVLDVEVPGGLLCHAAISAPGGGSSTLVGVLKRRSRADLRERDCGLAPVVDAVRHAMRSALGAEHRRRCA